MPPPEIPHLLLAPSGPRNDNADHDFKVNKHFGDGIGAGKRRDTNEPFEFTSMELTYEIINSYSVAFLGSPIARLLFPLASSENLNHNTKVDLKMSRFKE